MATETMTVESPPRAETNPAKTAARLREQTATVRKDVRELGKLTKEVSQEKFGQARQTATDYLQHGQEKAHQVEDKVVTYVHEKPLQSLCIAAGMGALVGFLLTRR